jgi:hypothetical protein
MGYYGSDPAPVSTEPADQDVTDALQDVQDQGDFEAQNDELGDGLMRVKHKAIDF